MPPDSQRYTAPIVPARDQPTPAIPSREAKTTHHEAVANVARDQITAIYEHHDPVGAGQAGGTEEQAAANPYQRTHSTVERAHAEQWQHYHSAWQRYYQQYYERYYVGEVYRAKTELAAQAPARVANGADRVAEPADSTLNKSEAMYDLRRQLRSRMAGTASKVRASRHFLPIAAALTVMLVFVFLQYNRTIFAAVEAYKSPGNIEPANIIVNPTENMVVGPEPLLIIPKINVEVPVDYTAQPDHESQMSAMENGVAYFGIPGANAVPGRVGNTVIAGHSSNDVFDGGAYKFIFAQLDRLEKGDSIYLNYEGTRYTYSVTGTEVVDPSDVEALRYPTDQPVLTLITCTPTGTDLYRLLVTAKQISPDPSKAKPAKDNVEIQGAAPAIPGDGSPSFMERIFGS